MKHLKKTQNLDPLLLLEFLKCQIRNKTISYFSLKLKEKKEKRIRKKERNGYQNKNIFAQNWSHL